MKLRTLVTLVALAVAGSAFAQATAPAAPVAPAVAKDPTATPNIDKRQVNQEKRIQQGAASGQLTPREQNRLQAREGRIASAETAAKADGKVTKNERAHLQKMENKTSHAIHRQKHDGQRMAAAKKP